MIRKTGIYYYCNLASPSVYDGEAVKNIDYDLDVKCFPDGRIQILDEDEYEEHSMQMGYSEEIKEIIEWQMDVLLNIRIVFEMLAYQESQLAYDAIIPHGID